MRFACICAVAWVAACSTSDASSPATSVAEAGTPDAGSPNDASPPPTDAAIDSPIPRDLGTDRTKFFGASRCGSAGVAFCEDFEAPLDTTTWTTSTTGDATVTVETGQHARGAQALHVKRTGNGQAFISEKKTFPLANDTYFGRAFVWFDSLPTVSGAFTYAHWTIIAASGSGTQGEIRVSGQLQTGGNHFGVGTDSGDFDGGTGDWTTSDNDPAKAPAAVPTKQWLCIEWMHAGGATNETRFFWDAVEHPSLHTTSTTHGGNANPYILPTFDKLWIGWYEYQATTEPFEMWVDEIAIDAARIGCVI